MFKVRFNPNVARLREILKKHDLYAQDGIISYMTTHLQQLNIPDDQLFISLLFYTRQDLWGENCVMFRALNAPLPRLPASLFVKLVDILNLAHFYARMPCLPFGVCSHLISMLSNSGEIGVPCLEAITRSITDCAQGSDQRVGVQVLDRILRGAKLSMMALVESVAWLVTQDSLNQGIDIPDNSSSVVEEFVASVREADFVKYHPAHSDCVSYKDVDEVDTQSVLMETVSVISKQYADCFHSLISKRLQELIGDLSTAEGKDDIAGLCRCYHYVKRVLRGFHIITSHEAFTQQRTGDQCEANEMRQQVMDSLAQAESYMINHEKFMLSIVQSATSKHDERKLAVISSHILSYLKNSRVREILITQSAGMRWSPEHSAMLLHTLRSECAVRESTNDSSPHIDALQKITLQVLSSLDSRSMMLRFEFLSEYSECFCEAQTRSQINLSLNKIRPQNINQCETSSNTLAVLLSLHPAEVIKSLTYQILRSTSALAAIMCKVYVSVMSTSMLPLNEFMSYMEELKLSRQQLDDLLSKTLLFLPKYESPVTSNLFRESAERLSLDNEHLPLMLKNVESVLTSADADAVERFDRSVLSSLALFTLSVVDSITMVTTEKSGGDGLLRLAVRLLTTSQISGSVNDMESDVFGAALTSLHPNTYRYLNTEKVLLRPLNAP